MRRVPRRPESDDGPTWASEQTEAALESIAAIDGILANRRRPSQEEIFNSFRDERGFPEPHPVKPRPLALPQAIGLPPRPEPVESFPHATVVSPSRRLIEFVFPPAKKNRLANEKRIRDKEIAQVEATTEAQLEDWRRRCASIQERNSQATSEVETWNRKVAKRYMEATAAWEVNRLKFYADQEAANRGVEEFRTRFQAGDPVAVERFFRQVLRNSQYPTSFPKKFRVRYVSETKHLIVAYALPTLDSMPSKKGVKYVRVRHALDPVPIPVSVRRQLYDKAVYQTLLRVLHELFGADVVGTVDAIALNGIVETVSRSTGNNVAPCIASLQVSKEEFSRINLDGVDPKVCFRHLKGVGSPQLWEVVPVAPLVHLDRDDERFVEGREVLGSLGHGTNLAAMPWEDFEHLVRQLFEMESSVDTSKPAMDGHLKTGHQ